MKNVKHLLVSLVAIFSGMVMGSLWISHSENWKTYLPMVLICISLRLAFLKDE